MKIGAVVILYHPDGDLKQRILSYLPHVSKLFIFDNSEKTNNSLIFDGMAENEKLVYYTDGENKGISTRLNQAIELCQSEKIDWLLTMDQDSFFDKSTITNYLDCFESYTQKQQVAMFGVNFLDKEKSSINCDAEKARHLITSGSLVNISAASQIGLFDEALFIDKVDHEYCLRARQKGFDIVEFRNIYLNHSLGTVVYGRSLKNLKKTPRNVHSPIRIYYILRNYYYVKRKYESTFKDSIEEMKKENWVRIKNNFLYGKKRLLLISYIVKAYADFRKGKMGKIA